VAPLELGEPFEVVEEKEVWHPVWKGKINDKMNAQFIKAAFTTDSLALLPVQSFLLVQTGQYSYYGAPLLRSS
jgi:hypothetical protein